jgi:hypothetical protein
VRNTWGVTLPVGFTSYLGARPAAAFGYPEEQVIPPNTWTALRWHRLDEPPPDETATAHDPAHPSRYIAPLSGLYKVDFVFTVSDEQRGAVSYGPCRNGAPFTASRDGRFLRGRLEGDEETPGGRVAQIVPVAWSGFVPLLAGDVCEAIVRHTFTEDLVLAPGSAHMIVHYLGAT